MSALNMKLISILLILVCMDSFALGRPFFNRGGRRHHRIRAPLNKRIINTTSAAAPLGPYSQAVVVGRMMFISGQVGIDLTSGQLVSGARNQTEQALRNMRAILSAARADFTHVVKTTVLLADVNDLSIVNEVYNTTFTRQLPARSSFQPAALPLGALVEIEAIASLPRRRRGSKHFNWRG